jgi:CBS domain containing-hemolysin-like protein
MWIFWYILLIVLSALFEGVLAAIMKLNKYELQRRARLGSDRAQLISPLRQRGRELALLFMIGSVLSAMGALVTATTQMPTWSALLLTTALVVCFRLVARSALRGKGYKIAQRSSAYLLRILDALRLVLEPLSQVLMKPSLKVSTSYYSKEELIEVLSEHKEGPETSLKTRDIDTAKSALVFSDKTAQQVMTVRDAITTVSARSAFTLKTLDALYKSGHQWFPVIESDSIEECVGMINLAQAVAAQSQSESAAQLELMESVYVPIQTSLPEALSILRDTPANMGLVVDEQMQVEGLITLDDIIAELVPEHKQTE